MRRWYLVALPVAAVLGMLAAVSFTAPQSPGANPPAATQTSDPAPPAESGTGTNDVPTLVLDLPPLEVDEAWFGKNAAEPGSVGVVWISKDGADPARFLTSTIRTRFYESFQECFPADATAEQLFEGKQTCFDERVIRAAATTPNPIDVFVAIAALNVARPDVFTVCHNASHKVGEIALRRVLQVHGMNAEIITALLDAAGGGCMGGLMHGVLDAVGLTAKTTAEFEPAVEACMRANQENLGYCTDAVGHATWDAFGSTDKAVPVCALFPQPTQRRECGEGILMRMYQRAESKGPWYVGQIGANEMGKWVDEITAICSTWPSKALAAGQEDPREWCWSGSVYLLYKPVFQSLEDAGGVFADAERQLLERAAAVVDGCLSFPAPGDALCLDRTGPFVGHASAFDMVNAAKICALYPTKQVEVCLAAAKSRIDAAYAE